MVYMQEAVCIYRPTKIGSESLQYRAGCVLALAPFYNSGPRLASIPRSKSILWNCLVSKLCAREAGTK